MVEEKSHQDEKMVEDGSQEEIMVGESSLKKEDNNKGTKENGEIKEIAEGKEGKKEKKIKKDKGKSKKKISESESIKEEIQKLKRKHAKLLEKKEEELSKQKEKFAYLQAEMENMRKHYQKQIVVEKEKAQANTIMKFTPLLESFEKAMEMKEKIDESTCSDIVKSFLEGFKNLNESLNDTFKSLKVEPIDETGGKFDYKFHEVMMRMENPELEDNTVVQILQKGYKIGDKVIRPAKIIVSKKPAPPKKEEPAEKEEDMKNKASEKDEQDAEKKSAEDHPENNDPGTSENKV